MAALVLLLSGCGESSPEPTPDAGSDEDDFVPPTLCLTPDNLAPVLPRTTLPEGAVITQLAVDDEYVYFAQYATLYRLNKQGGEPEQLFADSASFTASFAVRDEELLVVTSSGSLVTLSKAGELSSSIALPAAPAVTDLTTGQTALVFGEEAVYFVGEDGTLYTVELASGDSHILATLPSLNGRLALAGDRLYWVEAGSRTSSADAAYLRSLPLTGGTPNELELELPPELPLDFGLLGAVDEQLFLNVELILGRQENAADAALTAAGVYRVERAGGLAAQVSEAPAVDIFSGFGILPPLDEVIALGDDALVRTGSVDALEVLRVTGDAEPQKVFCLDLGLEAPTTMTADDDALYLAMGEEDEAFILRYDF